MRVDHSMKTVGEPESDWLLCWVLSLSQSDAGSPTSPLSPLASTLNLLYYQFIDSQYFYSNHHSIRLLIALKSLIVTIMPRECLLVQFANFANFQHKLKYQFISRS